MRMREQALKVFAPGLGQEVRVEYRAAADAIAQLERIETRVKVAAKLAQHRELMTRIFADLLDAGAPLALAMKFLPKDAVVLVGGGSGAADRPDAAPPDLRPA